MKNTQNSLRTLELVFMIMFILTIQDVATFTIYDESLIFVSDTGYVDNSKPDPLIYYFKINAPY